MREFQFKDEKRRENEKNVTTLCEEYIDWEKNT